MSYSPAQDNLDEETATFFTHVDNAIKKLKDGKEDKCPGPQGLSWIYQLILHSIDGGQTLL